MPTFKKYHRPAQIKKTPTDGSGEFSAYLATWDRDRQGEKFAPGAFTVSIMEWSLTDYDAPILFGHQSENPNMVIGYLVSMREDSKGLLVSGRLDLSSMNGQTVYEALLAGTLKTLSIGFVPKKTHRDGDVLVIDEADILECSFTPTPANPNARLVSVKEAPTPKPEHLFDQLMAEQEAKTTDAQVAAFEAEQKAIREAAHAKAAYDRRLQREMDERVLMDRRGGVR